MNHQGIQRAIEDELYEWAMSGFMQEVQSGFPLLKRVKSSQNLASIEVIERLKDNNLVFNNSASPCAPYFHSLQRLLGDDIRPLIGAITRRAHQPAIQRRGDTFSMREYELLQLFDANVTILCANCWNYIPIKIRRLVRSKGRQQLLPPEAMSDPFVLGNVGEPIKKILWDCVRQEVEPLFGNRFTRAGTTEYTIRLAVHKCQLVAEIDLGMRDVQLFYRHSLRIAAPASSYDGSSPALAASVISGHTLLSAYGLGRTTWDLLLAGDELEAARTLRAMCVCYFSIIEEVLRKHK